MPRISFLAAALLAAGASSVQAQTWSFAYTGSLADLNDIQFVTTTTAYVATGSGVRKTTDAGAAWAAAGTLSERYSGVSFVNNDTGWVAGDAGEIRKTTNGGSAWTSQTANGGGAIHLRNVFFADASNGFALRAATNNSGNMIRTTNGGDTWTAGAIGTGDASNSGLWRGTFVTPAIGYVVGKIGVHKTTDMGATWTSVSTGLPSGLLFRGLEFLSADTGYVAGDSGAVFKTVNGGAAWTQVLGTTATLKGVNFTDIDCVNASLCYAAGFGNGTVSGLTGGHVYKTANGGATWESNFTLGTSVFNAIAFPTASVGFVLGTGGTLRKTDAVTALTPGSTAARGSLRLGPANGSRHAVLTLARAGRVTVSLRDLAGKTLHESVFQGRAGENFFVVPALGGESVGLLQVRSAEGSNARLLTGGAL